MPFSYVAAALPVITSVAGGLLGGDSAPSGNVYQPGGTANIDSLLQGLLSGNASAVNSTNNPYTTYNPQFQQAFQQLFNTPGQSGFQTSSNNAGQGYTNVGNQSLLNSSALSGGIGSLLAGGQQVGQMGLDPQNALYAQMLQKTNDQSNINNAQYGLTGQQAAGNTNQADANFNIDWQNNELQRAIAGLQGQAGATNAAGTAATGAQNVGSSGAAAVGQGGAVPYGAGQTIGTAQESALGALLSQLLGGVNSSQSTIGDLSQYLGQGISASAQQGALQNQNFGSQLLGGAMGSQAGQGIGSMLQSLFGSTQATPAVGQTNGINNTALDAGFSYGYSGPNIYG